MWHEARCHDEIDARAILREVWRFGGTGAGFWG